MAILIDLSQVVLSSCYAFQDQLSLDKTEEDRQAATDLIRHVILSQIKYYNARFKTNYGKLIISTDGRNYWRKQIFPYYKACRKKARSTSNLDWNLIFDTINQTIEDLRENFMFPVINVEHAESDDIIATLTKYFQTNECTNNILVSEPQKILIVSSDKDFIQLQKYRNVSQFSPRAKQFIKEDNPEEYLTIKVLKGDAGDGIPSVMNDDDALVQTDHRCSPLTKNKIAKLMESGLNNCTDSLIKERWIRNKTLIDFDHIPQEIENNIIEQYKSPIKGDKVKIFNYFIKHNCNILLKDISAFTN